jgi:hypothetical protein
MDFDLFHKERILILCKTYPSPSARYSETSCVAGMKENGDLIRLYPVPFRFITDAAQFRKWQWIDARIEKATNDHRPESHRIAIDTIICEGEPIPTRDQWQARRVWLDKAATFNDFQELERARVERGNTLGVLRVSELIGLDITPVEPPDWTDDEKAKLLQLQQQGNLFDPTDSKSFRTLRKVPFDFHYRYLCEGIEGAAEYRHKIVDWEASALYWNVRKSHGRDWQNAFRKKMEREFATKDLSFLMGTIHRFPNQWLIVSLLYPPKQRSGVAIQESLL